MESDLLHVRTHKIWLLVNFASSSNFLCLQALKKCCKPYTMRVAGIQFSIEWEAPEVNFKRLAARIAHAASVDARLVILPEMFSCGFSMDTNRIAEKFDGPSAKFLQEQAKKHQLWICGSFPEKSQTANKPYNTLMLVGPQGEAFRYHKIHPFSFAREHEHYSPGEQYLTVDVEGLRCTFFICYDLRFADEFWQTAGDTDLYVVVANWPKLRRKHWKTLAQARAIENQAYVAAINRVGIGNNIEYSGDSCFIDPWGEILASASMKETMLLADIEASYVQKVRETFPVMQDRRLK